MQDFSPKLTRPAPAQSSLSQHKNFRHIDGQRMAKNTSRHITQNNSCGLSLCLWGSSLSTDYPNSKYIRFLATSIRLRGKSTWDNKKTSRCGDVVYYYYLDRTMTDTDEVSDTEQKKFTCFAYYERVRSIA